MLLSQLSVMVVITLKILFYLMKALLSAVCLIQVILICMKHAKKVLKYLAQLLIVNLQILKLKMLLDKNQVMIILI